ncbi:nuclear transport factor 2 family protein [Nocardia neocaledoniensis]|uniref:nuclear transport factor 2 family protein n=1 Tax=Nocardia neocaledoniensis TaxID=236511 RepID=UPI00245409FD|nr:nuclear transport factor 2 family protein [Nocardia neocaledoniensis]
MPDNELSLVERIDLLESRAALNDLVANYCHGMDKHDLDLFLSIWHPDAEFLPGEPFGAFRGTNEIKRATTDLIWTGLPHTRHLTMNFVPQIDGDRAIGRADVSGEATDPSGTTAVISASYEDVFERRDGVWRISERRIIVLSFSGFGEDWRLDPNTANA